MNEDNQKSKGGGGAWAVFLIVVGVILLLNNLGFLPWEIWSILWRFWPVLLILGGLEMVFGHSSSWSRLVVTLLGLVVAAFVVALALTSVNPRLRPNWLQRIFPNLPEEFWFQPELPEELLTCRP